MVWSSVLPQQTLQTIAEYNDAFKGKKKKDRKRGKKRHDYADWPRTSYITDALATVAYVSYIWQGSVLAKQYLFAKPQRNHLLVCKLTYKTKKQKENKIFRGKQSISIAISSIAISSISVSI